MCCLSCWHTSTSTILLQLPLIGQRPLYSSAAWTSPPRNHQPFFTSPQWQGQADDIDLKRWCSVTIIASYQADYIIYTNGSTSGGARNGGAAAVVIKGSRIQPEVVTTIKIKVRLFTSSYEKEAAAMESALSWANTNVNHPSITILFCADSKSLYQALLSSNPCKA